MIASLVHTLCASDDEYAGRFGEYVELGGRANPDSAFGSIGFFEEVSDQITLKGGISFLASESFDDIFTGGNLDVQYSLGMRFSPFIGAGVFAGYSEEIVSAEDDNIDNDDDGFVDESGEEKSIVDDVIASVYPEAGFHYWITEEVKLAFSGKYHVVTEGREYDFWIFSTSFNLSFK